MEDSGLFRALPGGLTLADLFGPLTTPIPCLALKDKVKVTLRSNAGVKCLKMKISLPGPPALPAGSPEGLVSGQVSFTETTSVCKEERPRPWKGGDSTSICNAPAHIKEEPRLYAVGTNRGAGTYCSGNKGEFLPSKRANIEYTESSQSKCVPTKEELLSSGEGDLPGTQDGQHIGIKDEPLAGGKEDLERPSYQSNSKQYHLAKKAELPPCSLHIKEEPLSDEDLPDLDGTQIITVKIKEEPNSSEEENEGQPANLTWEEPPSHQMEHSTSPIAEKTRVTEQILPRSVPLLIRNPRLNQRKVTMKKEPKTGLLKKVRDLGADHKQEVRTLICTPLKMYKCSKCGRCFTSRGRLMRHSKVHRKYKVPCQDCGRRVACRHRGVHWKEKPFPCSFCQKHFSTDKGCEIHERRHADNKPFTCHDCGKSFLFKVQLKAHQMLHISERYTCHECGRCYRTKAGLTLHMKIHRGEMSYFCPECGKGFVQKSNLRNHLRVHSNVKGYTCPECGKAFRQRNNLKQHMSIHAAKECERHSCSECGRSYKRKADYRWHMLIHLGEKCLQE